MAVARTELPWVYIDRICERFCENNGLATSSYSIMLKILCEVAGFTDGRLYIPKKASFAGFALESISNMC